MPATPGSCTHNPFHPRYETLSGRDEPYSLRELAACVELPRMVPRRKAEIRTDGRNVETFRPPALLGVRANRRVSLRAARDVERRSSPRGPSRSRPRSAPRTRPAHPYTDAEALDTAKSVAGWVWLRYVGGSLTRVRADAAARRENDRQRAIAARRARGAVPRDVWLAEVQRRRVAAATLRGLGVAVDEIARRLSAGVRTVHRWLSEFDPSGSFCRQVRPHYQTLSALRHRSRMESRRGL